jgi:hypothetical protein
MRTPDRSLSTAIVILAGMALGVRLAIVTTAPFPLNDGGLFFAFISDLLANCFQLPAFSTYNTASIPLAYPPLAFYLVAALSYVLSLPVLQLLQFTPALLSVASVPAFYFLAEEFLGSRSQAALATLVFALLPRTSDWLIMGGGITRSLGLLFALLAMHRFLLLFGRRQTSAILPAIIICALLVLSHPEAATHAALTAALIFAWRDRSREGLRNAALVGGGIIVLTAPWWVVIAQRHGLDPFIAAAAAARQDSYNVLIGLVALFRFEFTDEPILGIFAALGLLGIAVKVSRREYFLATWLLLMHTIEPRGGALFMMIPLATGAGFCLDAVVLPALRPTSRSPAAPVHTAAASNTDWLSEMLRGRGPRLLLGLLVAYGCLSTYAVGARIQREFTLNTHDLQAFEWVRQNTDQSSRFALVTQALPLRDASSEWFPVLTDRQSLATVFGLEWVRGADFAERTEMYRLLQACATQDVLCLEAWALEKAQSFNYVYVRDAEAGRQSALSESLKHAAGYELAYSDDGILIFRRR